MKALVLSALLALSPAWEDREEVGRADRLSMIADAIAHAADNDREIAAALITTGWWESRYSRRIHAGRCGRMECDAVHDIRGRVVAHRARSPWQVQASAVVPYGLWRRARGLTPEATQAGADAAATALRWARARCKTRLGMLALYATGKRCRWAPAHDRARMVDRIMDGWADE